MPTLLSESLHGIHGLHLPETTPLSREEVDDILKNARSATEIILTAGKDPCLRELLNTPTQLFEGHTIGEHTEMVLGRLYMYPFLNEKSQSSYPWSLSHREFALAYLLHDLGKRLPDAANLDMSKEAQHQRTLTILHHYRPVLPVTDDQLRVLVALIDGDPLGVPFRQCLPHRPSVQEKEQLRDQLTACPDLGAYFSCVDSWERRAAEQSIPEEESTNFLRKAAVEIRTKAHALGMDPLQFLHYQTIFFQCDASSYTWDARTPDRRGVPSLDFMFQRNKLAQSPDNLLFKFDHTRGRLCFSPPFEKLYQTIEGFCIVDLQHY